MYCSAMCSTIRFGRCKTIKLISTEKEKVSSCLYNFFQHTNLDPMKLHFIKQHCFVSC